MRPEREGGGSSGRRGAPVRAALVAAVAALLWFSVPPAVRAGDLDFPPTDFTLRSIDGAQIIGKAHATATRGENGLVTLHGENRFNDGSHDVDEAVVREGSNGALPTLVSARHWIFNPDGSPERESSANVPEGTGECTVYIGSKAEVNRRNLDFPPDTFAGETVMIPLRRFLASGATGSFSFHDFNCIPEPKVLKVTASVRPPARWDFYPGRLVRVDVKPDFGWLNVIISPFVPQISAWFDPARDWLLVGAESARYYKGLKYLVVRDRAADSAAQAAGQGAPAGQPAAAGAAPAGPTPGP